MNEFMTVGDLIDELSHLDRNAKIVVPDAPYGQPTLLTRVGGIVIKDDEMGIPDGEYIGLNLGSDFDDESLYEEPESSSQIIIENEDKLENIKKNPIVAENIDDFIGSISQMFTEGKL